MDKDKNKMTDDLPLKTLEEAFENIKHLDIRQEMTSSELHSVRDRLNIEVDNIYRIFSLRIMPKEEKGIGTNIAILALCLSICSIFVSIIIVILIFL